MANCGFMSTGMSVLPDGSTDPPTNEVLIGRRSVWINEFNKYLNNKNLKAIYFFDRRKICLQKLKVQEKV